MVEFQITAMDLYDDSRCGISLRRGRNLCDSRDVNECVVKEDDGEVVRVWFGCGSRGSGKSGA